METVNGNACVRSENDALMETFYEIVGERYQSEGDYAISYFMTDTIFRQKGKIMSVRVNLKKCLNT